MDKIAVNLTLVVALVSTLSYANEPECETCDKEIIAAKNEWNCLLNALEDYAELEEEPVAITLTTSQCAQIAGTKEASTEIFFNQDEDGPDINEITLGAAKPEIVDDVLQSTTDENQSTIAMASEPDIGKISKSSNHQSRMSFVLFLSHQQIRCVLGKSTEIMERSALYPESGKYTFNLAECS